MPTEIVHQSTNERCPACNQYCGKDLAVIRILVDDNPPYYIVSKGHALTPKINPAQETTP